MRFSPSRRTVASLAASLDRRPGNTVHASTNSRLRVCSPLLPSVDLSPRLLSRKRASFALGTETNDVETELRESPQHVRHTEVEEEKEKERRRIYIRRWWRAETSTTVRRMSRVVDHPDCRCRHRVPVTTILAAILR